MTKYFKCLNEASAYVINSILVDGKKRTVQVEELKMNDNDIFYKVTIELVGDNVKCGDHCTPEVYTVNMGYNPYQE